MRPIRRYEKVAKIIDQITKELQEVLKCAPNCVRVVMQSGLYSQHRKIEIVIRDKMVQKKDVIMLVKKYDAPLLSIDVRYDYNLTADNI